MKTDAPASPLQGVRAPRVDGYDKVTGTARYGSDFAPGNSAWAFLKTSAIGKGRIIDFDERAARAVPGVIEILTYHDVGERVASGKMMLPDGYMGSTIQPLRSEQILHAGQIVAIVLADSFESAREAAHLLEVRYEVEQPASSFDADGLSSSPSGKEDPRVGDFDGAFARAPIRIDAEYETAIQHHNPLELFSTVAAWDGDKLTVWESSQNVWGFKNGLAVQLSIPVDDIRVISPFAGGAFGSRGSLTQRTALIAFAARRIGRPVKLVATREQGFTIATYRAETRHRVQLGASADGKLLALRHEGWEVSSRPDNYSVAGTDASTRLYGCPNVDSKVSVLHADRNTPGFMRSPPETPYLFALESAMDELAYALRIDPMQLRLLNDTSHEPIRGLPYTSRHLRECFEAASQVFGWSQRSSQPRSMRDGDWLVGWGCATTMYPSQVAPAAARVRLMPDGSVRVESATHEIGTGVRTAMAITASEQLGVPIGQVVVDTGDTRLPPAPVSGGSNSTASVCNAVAKACRDIRERLGRAAVGGESLSQAMARLGQGAIEAYVESIPPGAKPDAGSKLYSGKAALAGGAHLKDRVQFAFGAQFVEVRVHARTCEIRAPRAVGAFAFGRIINNTAAKSQLMGGQIWGISAALHEATEIDARRARYYNADLAEYLVPVNADVIDVQTLLLPELDTEVNELGIKGVGELGNVGMNAAVANAVYHATGVRVRKLPIRLEQLLEANAAV